ncbi:glucosamine-6-phosphate deaminase [Roseimaritima ulvae]|uniref:Glucosamine-6-phosphate deaminase n=1 Tax=Roseimaritima ulvae TaxID=980254 RepID=A0A5B9R8Z6_9BACT|nr:glucosamine-6-phosphate deaminase [Roseimaritima ulvae]QEG43381.1 Glucosamine-6-phosphate deaminase [Roseimaritima ulvae]
MRIEIASDVDEMGRLAAERAAAILRDAISDNRRARMIVATGASQFTVLEHLTKQPDIDWQLVDGFHLDEYIGIDRSHPASFCRYLDERLVQKVPLGSFQFLDAGDSPQENVQRIGELVSGQPIDVALVGIGENGHLAFNDPPADFETTDPYLIVELDEPCRQQQVGEGWFGSLAEVPTHAISMSVQQIMKSRAIICSVPDARKAAAVQAAVEGPVTPDLPASILQKHANCTLLLDPPAAEKLSEATRGAAT